MFEKEADFAETKMMVECNGNSAKYKTYKEGFQEGAEFGYNKAKEEMQAQIEKMKSIGRTAYIKGVRTMANGLKNYDRTDGSWTDYFEHTVDKVLKKLLEEIKQ